MEDLEASVRIGWYRGPWAWFEGLRLGWWVGRGGSRIVLFGEWWGGFEGGI